jgi:hypothetical protein
MAIEDFIHDQLRKRVEKTVALIVYDPEKRYKDIVHELASDDCRVIDGSRSTILGREHALDTWRKLAIDRGKQKHLIVYLPVKKPKRDEERRQDPYQIFAIGGGEFPRDDGDEYQALCHKAAPDLVAQIDELFKVGVPDFDTINNLIEGRTSWPKLRTILKVESAAEILTAFLSPSDEQKKALDKDDTWFSEFNEFVMTTLGIKLRTKSRKWSKISEEVWRCILFSELAFDLTGKLSSELKDVPRAGNAYKGVVYTVCDNLRTSEKHQRVYMEMAGKVADDLQLEERMHGMAELGERDTFDFQEKTYLKAFVNAVMAGEIGKSSDLLKARKQSIWVKHTSERQVLWTTADRAFQLMTAINDKREDLKTKIKGLASLFSFYCEELRQVDRLHRELERAVSDTYGELDSVGDLVEIARKRYLQFAEEVQAEFISLIQKENWPVSGKIRSSQVFEKFVLPWIKERKKTAYFLVDALRYELGAELEKELSIEFATKLQPVCAQLPTITNMGMAVLMPESDGNIELVRDGDNIVPYVRGTKIVLPSDRIEYILSFYGDRCHMIDLDDLLTKKLVKLPETVDLLIVKTTDIDGMAEAKPIETYRMFPDIVKKLIAGVKKLRNLKFERTVIATDHGFMLLREREAGDTVEKPPGDWIKVKDRCLLGSGSANPGTVVFRSEEVGIKGDFENCAVPRTFATFAKGQLYYHGGLSLQECVLPVISVDLSAGIVGKPRTIDLHLSYKGGSTGRITTRRPLIEIAIFQAAIIEEELEFQLEAYDKKKVVGEVGTSNHINPATNLIKIRPGEAIKVPLKMDDDFEGAFEVRASDPVTGVIYRTLKLKTDYMD